MIQVYDGELGFVECVQLGVFSGGEVSVRLNSPLWYKSVLTDITIKCRIDNSDKLLSVLMTKDAIDRTGFSGNIILDICYIPYGRQDRVCHKGEALSSKVFADIINSAGFSKVITVDAHSDVSTVCIDNCYNKSQSEVISKNFLEMVRKDLELYCGPELVSPDAGANKKTLQLASKLGLSSVVRADKVRNLRTGAIEQTEVYSSDCEGKSYLIADDICDGGRTFIELAKVLKEKGASKVALLVTHGIFSRGYENLLDNGIDLIYVYDNWLQTKNDKVKELN